MTTDALIVADVADPSVLTESANQIGEFALFIDAVDLDEWDTADVLRLYRTVADASRLLTKTKSHLTDALGSVMDGPMEVDGVKWAPDYTRRRQGWQREALIAAMCEALQRDVTTADGEQIRAVPVAEVAAFFKADTGARKLRQLGLDVDEFSELVESFGIKATA